jgi:hypothetical protein
VQEEDGEGGGSWFPFSRPSNQTDGQTDSAKVIRNARSKFSSQLYVDGMICQGNSGETFLFLFCVPSPVMLYNALLSQRIKRETITLRSFET